MRYLAISEFDWGSLVASNMGMKILDKNSSKEASSPLLEDMVKEHDEDFSGKIVILDSVVKCMFALLCPRHLDSKSNMV